MKMNFKPFWSCLTLVFSLSLPGQVEEIRIMHYNLLYYKAGSPPCNHNRSAAQRDADLRTIFQSVLPDVFTVNELGTNPINPLVMLADIMNVDTIARYARAASSNNSSSNIVNMLFYNKNKLALVGQDQVALTPNNVPLLRVIDFYRLYVKDPALGQAGVDTVFFTIGVAHFKAGNSSADAARRLLYSESIMDYRENHNADDNFFMAGDFNVYTSSEAAYQHLINYPGDASLRLRDPINSPGSWNNNASFAAIHTQSTRAQSSGCHVGGGMDDRFDFILASQAVMNNSAGIDYKNYRTYGQDGSSYNGNLATTTNLSVNTTVATALYNFSDHLPVIIELEASVSGLGQNAYRGLAGAWELQNPGELELRVFFKNFKSEGLGAQMVLRSLDGQELQRWSLEERNGSYTRNFSLPKLSNGLYLVSLETETGNYRETRKWIKQ